MLFAAGTRDVAAFVFAAAPRTPAPRAREAVSAALATYAGTSASAVLRARVVAPVRRLVVGRPDFASSRSIAASSVSASTWSASGTVAFTAPCFTYGP